MFFKNINDYNKLDTLISPIVNIVAYFISFIANKGPRYYPKTYKICEKYNFIPFKYHYYNPIVKESMLPEDYDKKIDPLIGLNMQDEKQLNLLKKFNYDLEVLEFSLDKDESKNQFYFNNHMYASGDAEILYYMIRHFKPKRVIEIGSGLSTLLVKAAIDKNKEEGVDNTYHICIEPYHNPWLEELGCEIIRTPVEKLDLGFFSQLEENDILFIDSSHNIRTCGDVVYEYLKIIPSLNKGVITQIHDIFLPQEYPKDWIVNFKWFWTEQYLLQAFLAFNNSYEILLALNYLKQKYPEELANKCPVYAKQQETRFPGAFWFQKK